MAYSSIFEAAPAIRAERISASRFANGQFHNSGARRGLNSAGTLKGFWRYLTGKSPDSVPSTQLEVRALSSADLQDAPDQSLWRLGHSTVLLKSGGKFWLTDPVFAERASPFSFAGPKRFHAAPIAPEDLPPIEAVLLSHDHYDHLDQASILAIAGKVSVFVTPLGVGERLIGWGIPASKVRQLDWWEEIEVDGVRLIATPAQHFSGRSLSDRNSTLWASWAMLTPHSRLFFSGDSGYFAGFREIGERFGPFDLTLIENGAYNEAWADVHMQPKQTIQAHIDLKGQRLVPIHNGTFDLALHAWTDPLERITALAAQHHIALSTPGFGERLGFDTGTTTHAWWRVTPGGRPALDQPHAHNPEAALIAASGT